MIHPTAIVDPKAELADDVTVGPYSIIGEHVRIDAGTEVGPHVVINGHTRIGKNNRFFQFSSIGEENQDKKYAGEPTRTVIGDGNVFREACTVHRGTVQDQGETRIGNNGWFMAYTHIAHDCVLGDQVILSNNATLAGHVLIGDWVILSGFAKVHQFCQIGAHAFIGMNSDIARDVPPFVLIGENQPRAINTEGLKRRGFEAGDINDLRRAYKMLYRQGLKRDEAIAAIATLESRHCQTLTDFLKTSQRGILR